MAANLSVFFRVIRIIIGVLLTAWAIAGGPIWALIGIMFIATGAWGFSPLHATLAKRRRR